MAARSYDSTLWRGRIVPQAIDSPAPGIPVSPAAPAEPSICELRTRLASLAAECGCTMGGIFLAVALVSAGLYFLVRGGFDIRSALAALGLVFLASIIGKLVGLASARIRMITVRRMLAARLTTLDRSHVHLH